MKAVIMAGGRGTRISELFPDIPKPLIPIEGVPVLERELVSLRNQGFKDFIMTVSYMGDKIMNYFGNGSKLGVSIDADKIGTVDETTGKTVKVDWDRQLLKPLAGSGKMFCYDSPEYVKDMGTPARFHQVEEDYKAGRVSAKNLSNKQKAMFLDRDGTINKYVGFLRNIDDFELIDGVSEAIKKINASGYLAIVVTNQPVIARGEVTFQELEEIHNKMETLLGKEGAYLDAIYYCPHHPHKGYEGERPKLKIECDCRKPKPGMLLKAAEDYNIDLSQSWMIGDGENDVKAGINAGCKTVLLSNSDESYGQTETMKSLGEFVSRMM